MRNTSYIKKNSKINPSNIDNWSRVNTFKTTFEDFHGKRKQSYIPGYKGYIVNKIEIGKTFTNVAKNSYINKNNVNINKVNKKGLLFLLKRNTNNKKIKDLEAINHKYGQSTFSNTAKSLWPINKEKLSTYNNFFNKSKDQNKLKSVNNNFIIQGRSGYIVNNFKGNYNKIYKYNNNIKYQTEYKTRYIDLNK